MKFFVLLLTMVLLISCQVNTNRQNNPGDSVIMNYKGVPAERSSVNPNPVKTYSEAINSFETVDQFLVSLYETRKTFHFLVKIQYKNLDETDTLKVPDFGMQPSVEIIKGDKRPSCVIGFLDRNKKFRESKLIYFEDNTLKVHVLKHYAVSTYRDTL